MTDYTCRLPDDCLALIFNFLTTTNDRNNFSLVSHRWLQIDSETRTFLPLYAVSNIQPLIPSIFTRFKSLTKLVLHSRCYFSDISDQDIILITSMCPDLMRLKLSECNGLTDSGMAVFSKNCKELKEFSCDDCRFISDLGMFELLDNCTQLEVLSIWKLVKSSLPAVKAQSKFCAGPAVKTLKVIELKDVHSERLFEPLIIGSKKLNRLKLIHCGGNWDRSLEMIRDDNCLAEVHLEQVNVTDVGVSSLSKCRDLNALRIVNNLQCTNVGLISVAENCKGLKKLNVDDCVQNKIGNEGLIAVGKHSVNLQELVLIGVNATCVSLEVIATNCQKLVTLKLRRCVTITDTVMMCIAEKSVALKTLLIEKCDVSNKGIEAFAFPNMVSIRVSKCEKVTREIKEWLNAREKLIALKKKAVNAVTSDCGVQEHVVEVPPAENHEAFTELEPVSTSSSSIDNGGPTSLFNEGSRSIFLFGQLLNG